VGTVSLLLFDSTQYQFFCLSAFVAWGNAWLRRGVVYLRVLVNER
jgi:hypothetical protein